MPINKSLIIIDIITINIGRYFDLNRYGANIADAKTGVKFGGWGINLDITKDSTIKKEANKIFIK